MIGEISSEPKFGKKRLILFKKGSVNLQLNSKIAYTNLFWVLRTLKAINQLTITLAMTTQEYNFKICKTK